MKHTRHHIPKTNHTDTATEAGMRGKANPTGKRVRRALFARSAVAAVLACLMVSAGAAAPIAVGGGNLGVHQAYAKPVGNKNPEAKAHAEAVAKGQAPSKKDYSTTVYRANHSEETIPTLVKSPDNTWKSGLIYGTDGYSETDLNYTGLLNGAVYRGGNAKSSRNNPGGSQLDNDPNDFASVLPFGNVYIDTSKLNFESENDFVIDINPTYKDKFAWVAPSTNYAKDSEGHTPTMAVRNYYGQNLTNGIAYTGGLGAYLSNTDAYKNTPKTTYTLNNGTSYELPNNYDWLSSTYPSGQQGVAADVAAADDDYLYKFIFKNAATLPDGTLGNVVIKATKFHLEGSVDLLPGAPIGIQDSNHIGVNPVYYPVDANGDPLTSTVDANGVPLFNATGGNTAGSVVKAYVPSAGYVPVNFKLDPTDSSSATVQRTILPAFGFELSFDIEIRDVYDRLVAGSISYAAYDLDVASRQTFWGRVNTGDPANDYRFSEGLTIHKGSQSYAVVPNYDHAQGKNATLGKLIMPASPKIDSNTGMPDFDTTAEYTMNITKDAATAKGTGPADGVRFATNGLINIRNPKGTFDLWQQANGIHPFDRSNLLSNTGADNSYLSEALFNANKDLIASWGWNYEKIYTVDGNPRDTMSDSTGKKRIHAYRENEIESRTDANGNTALYAKTNKYVDGKNADTKVVFRGVFVTGQYDDNTTPGNGANTNTTKRLTYKKIFDQLKPQTYITERGDGSTFDTGFAVLLDSKGSSLTWSGAGRTDGQMQTTIFDTSMYTRVDQSHGTGGGIYIETYEKADKPADSDDSDETKESTKPVMAEGSVTFGKGEPVTATAVPEKGYRVSVIRVGEVPVGGNPKEGTAYTLVYGADGTVSIKVEGDNPVKFEDKQGETGTRVAKVHDDEFGDLTFELNSDGTVDVTIPSVTTHLHIHADFSADYYFYKIWQGGEQTTELTMTATPTRFVGEDGSRASVEYPNEAQTFKVSADDKYTKNGYVTVLKKEDLQTNKLTEDEKDNKILDDALENGNIVWRIKYPAEGVGFDDDGTLDWPELPIEEELKGNLPHTKTHVNRNFWFVTETVPTGWTGSYDNSKAEGRGLIDTVYGQWNSASDSSGSTLYRDWDGTRWGYLSVRDNDVAKTLIQTTNKESNAFMSPVGIGGKILNKRRAEVYGTKVWDDYDNGFGTRKAVTLHIDANKEVNGKTKDVLPEQEIPADATGDALTVVWGNGEKYTGYTYAENGTTRIPGTVRATDNVLPAYTDKGELITYTVREGDGTQTDVVPGYTLTSTTWDANYMNNETTPKYVVLESEPKPVTFGYKATNKLNEEEFKTYITFTKNIEGAAVTEAQRGQFEFTIAADDESKTPMPKEKTRRNGDVLKEGPEVITFGPITFNYANMVGDNGEALQTKTFTYTVTEQDFTDPKIANAGPITVTLTLTNNRDGSISITQGPESPSFNNTYKPVTITAEKKWEDGDPDNSQSVKLTLLQLEGTRSGVYSDSANTNPQTIRKSGNEWSRAEWKDLPRASASGVNTYAIYEDPVPGYTKSFSANTTTFKITTNENNAWEALEGKQPITVQLLQNGIEYESSVELKDNEWTHEWTGLPVVNPTSGVVYLYDYKIVDPTGQTDEEKAAYKETLAKWDRSVDYTPNVTVIVKNTKQYLSVTAEKIWNDDNNKAGKRADLTMWLKRHNVAEDELSDGHQKWEYIQCQQENNNRIEHMWTQLPVATNGNNNVYWLSETTIPDYYASSVEAKGTINLSIQTNDDVKERWKKLIIAEAPEIEVELLANGEPVESVQLNVNNDWKYDWKDKRTTQVDADGKVGSTVVYDWRVSTDSWPADWEFTTQGFEDQFAESTQGNNPLYKISVTNTLLKDVTVGKKWVGTPLQPVEIELMKWKGSVEPKSDNYTKSLTGDEASNWESVDTKYIHAFATNENYSDDKAVTYTFTGLPAYEADGNAIYYRAHELTVSPYFTTDYEAGPNDSLIVKNTFDAKGMAYVQAEKIIDGRNWLGSDNYQFRIEAVTADAPMPKGGYSATASSTTAHIATFPIEYNLESTDGPKSFEYKISEVPNDAATAVGNEEKTYETANETEKASLTWTYNGITYSKETHIVRVTFTYENTNQVTAGVEYLGYAAGADRATFTNTYNAKQDMTIPITKRVPNYTGANGDAFTFNVEPVSDAPMPVGQDGKSLAQLSTTLTYADDELKEGADTKSIDSPAIPIALSDLHRIDSKTGLAYGVFIYRITESKETNAKFAYDDSEIYVRVTVKDMGDGTLDTNCEYFSDALCRNKIENVTSALFTNSLMRTFKVTKRWDGPVMTDSIIQVERQESDNSWRTARDVNGNEAILTFSRASFDNMTSKEVTQTVTVPVYDSDGNVITYRAREVAPVEAGVFKTTTEPEASGDETEVLKVTNKYEDPAPTVQVAAVKELLGRTWLDPSVDTYDFQLKATAKPGTTVADAELGKVPMPGGTHGNGENGNGVLASQTPGTAAKRQGSLVSKADEYLALFAPITISVNDLTFNPRTGYFEGDFYYELQEVMPKGNDVKTVLGSVNGVTQPVACIKDGVTYPAGKVHTVHIHARDNLHGDILTYVHYDESTTNPLGTQFTPVVTNEYDATGTATATVQKTLAGREWRADDSFTFTMRPIGGAPFRYAEGAKLTEDYSALEITVTGGSENADATHAATSDNITFRLSDLSKTVGEGKDGEGNTISVDEDNKPIAYSAPVNGSTTVPAGLKYDTFVYVIEEVEPEGATGLLYDKETEYVKYTVIDTGKGTLDVQTAYYEDKECTKLRTRSDGTALDHAPFTNVELKEVKVKKIWQGIPNSDVTVTLQKVEIAQSDIAEESENCLPQATPVTPTNATTADEDTQLVSYDDKTFQIARNAFVVQVGNKYYQITNGYFPAEVDDKIYQVPDSGWYTNLKIPHWTFIDQNEWSTVSATTHEFNNEDFESAGATVEGSNNTSSQEYTFKGLPMQVTRTENGVAVDKTVVYRVVENENNSLYTVSYAASAQTLGADGAEDRTFTITNVSKFNGKGAARVSTVKELQGRPWKAGSTEGDEDGEDDEDGDEGESSVDTGESFAFLLTPIGKGTYYTAAEAQADSTITAGQLKDPLADLEDGKNINDALLEKSGESVVTDIPVPSNATAHAVAGTEFNLSSQRPATFDDISFRPSDLVRTEDGTWQGDFYYKLTEQIGDGYVALKRGTGKEQLYHAINGVPYVEAEWVDGGTAKQLTWKDYAEGQREKDSEGNVVNTTYTYWLDTATGLAYSSKEHIVHVHVEQSGDQLVTQVSYDGDPVGAASPVFTNYYDAYGKDFSVVIKHIAGRAWNAASATDDSGNTVLEGDAFRYYFRQVGGAVMDPTAGDAKQFTTLTGGNNATEAFGGVIIDSDTWMTPAVTSASQPVDTGDTGDFADRAIRSGEGIYHLSQLTYNAEKHRYEGKFVHAITEVESYTETDEDGNEHVRWPKVEDLAYDGRTIYMQTEVWDNGDGTLSNKHRYFTEATCSEASEIKGPDGNPYQAYVDANGYPVESSETQVNAAYFANSKIADVPVKKEWVGTPVEDVTVQLWRAKLADGKTVDTLQDSDWEPVATHVFPRGNYKDDGSETDAAAGKYVFDGFNKGLPMYDADGNQYVYRVVEEDTSGAYTKKYALDTGESAPSYSTEFKSAVFQGEGTLVVRNTTTASNTASVAAVKQLVGRQWLDSDQFQFKLEPLGRATYDENGKIQYDSAADSAGNGPVVLAKKGNTDAIDKDIPMPEANEGFGSETQADGTSSVTVASKDKAQVGEGEHLARFGAITFITDDSKCVLVYDPQEYHLQGDYFYKLSEVVPDGATPNDDGTRTKDGITYTDKVSVVHLKVRENRTDNLQVQVLYDDYKLTDDGKLVLSGQEGSLFTQVFTNHYDASSATSATVEPLVQVWKQKAGGTWKAGESYDFTMQALAGAPFRDATPAEFKATDDEGNTIEDARTSESVAALLGKGKAAHTSEGAHIVRLTVPADGDGLTVLTKAFPALEFRLSDLTQTVPESNKEEDKVALGNDAILYSDRNKDNNKKGKFVPAGTKYGRFIYAIEEAVPADATRNPDGTYSKDGVQYDPDTEYARITAIDNEDGTIDLVVEYFEDRFCKVRRHDNDGNLFSGAPFTNVATHSVFIQKDWEGVANEDVTVHLERAVITDEDTEVPADTIGDIEAYTAPEGKTLVTVGTGPAAKHYLVADAAWQGQVNGYSAWPAGASYVRTFTTSEFATTTQVEHEFTGLPSHDAITDADGKIIYRTFVYRIVESEPKRADGYTKTYVHQVTSGVHAEQEWGGASNPLEVKNTSNYEASGTASIAALKELTGREFKADDNFSFTLSPKGSYAYYTADEVQSDASHKAGQTKTGEGNEPIIDDEVPVPMPQTSMAVASTAEGATQRRATFSDIAYSMDNLVRDPDTGVWRRDYLYQLAEVIPDSAVAVDADGTEVKVTGAGAIEDTGTNLTYQTARDKGWLAPAGAQGNAEKAFVWFKVPYGTSGYNGITYDGRVHEVRVHLEDSGNGSITTSCFYDGESTVAPIFSNTYKSQVMTRGWVIKHINGRAWGSYTAPSFSKTGDYYAAADGKLTAANEDKVGGDAFQFTITGIGGAAMHPTTSGLVDNVWTTPVMTAKDNAAANPGADASMLDTIVLKSDASGNPTDVAMRTGEGLLTSDALDANGDAYFLYAINEKQGVTYTLPTEGNASASYDVAAQDDLDYDDGTIYLLIEAHDNWDGTIRYENQYYEDAACTRRIDKDDTNTVYLSADDKLVATSGEGIHEVQAAYFENERVLDIPVTKTWKGVPVEDVTLRLEQALVDEGMSETEATAAYEAGNLTFAQKGYVITLPRAYFLNGDGTMPAYDAANAANNIKEFEDAAHNTFTRTVNEDGSVSVAISAKGFNLDLPMYVKDGSGTQKHAVYRLTEDDTSDAYTPSSTDAFFFDSGGVDMVNTSTATNTANIAAVKQLIGRTWLDDTFDKYGFELRPLGKGAYYAQGETIPEGKQVGDLKPITKTVDGTSVTLGGDGIDTTAAATMPMPEANEDRMSTTADGDTGRVATTYATKGTAQVDTEGGMEHLARFGAITYDVNMLSYDPIDRHHQGDFFYEMCEVEKTGDGARGITYSTKVSIVHVRVRENRTDDLQVSIAYDESTLGDVSTGTQFTPVFTNAYHAEKATALKVRKYLMGRDWKEGETFDFEIRPMGSAPFVGDSYERVAYLDGDGMSTRIGAVDTTATGARSRDDLLNDGYNVVTSDGGMVVRARAEQSGSGLGEGALVQAFNEMKWTVEDLNWTVGEDGAKDRADTSSASATVAYSDGTTPAPGLKYQRFMYAITEVGASADDLMLDADTEYLQVTAIDEGDGTLDLQVAAFEDRYGTTMRHAPHASEETAGDPVDYTAFVNQATRDLTVKKVWDGIASDAATVTLQRSAGSGEWEPVESFTFPRVGEREHTFHDVPIYAKGSGEKDLDLDDEAYSYRVVEASSTNYLTLSYTHGDGAGAGDGEGHFRSEDEQRDDTVVITNKSTVQTVTMTVTKKWEDAAAPDGTRPSRDDYRGFVHLFVAEADEDPANATAVTGDPKPTVSQDATDSSVWTLTWAGLPATDDDGRELAYYVREIAVSGYTAEPAFQHSVGDSETITNTWVVPEVNDTTVTVTKKWVDASGRSLEGSELEGVPKVTFHLVGSVNEDTGKVTFVHEETKEIASGSEGSASWENVAIKYHGHTIAYDVVEDPVPGYVPTVTKTGDYTFEVINKQAAPTGTVKATKEWDDNGDQDDLRKAVTLKLQSRVGDGEWKDVSAEDIAGATVYVKVGDGEESEEQRLASPVTSYEFKVGRDQGNTASIRWENLPTTADGSVSGTARVTTQVVAGDDVNLVDAPPADEVRAADAAAADADAGDGAAAADGAADGAVDSTQTAAPADGTAAADGSDDSAQTAAADTVPDDADATVVAADGAADGTVVAAGDGAAADSGGPGAYVLALRMLTTGKAYADEAQGTSIYYRVVEAGATETDGSWKLDDEDYRLLVSQTADGDWILRNIHEPAYTSVTAKKTWADADNAENTRPHSITLRLLANGEHQEHVAQHDVYADADGTWSTTWDALPVYDEGKAIVYTVEEESVPDGYTVSGLGDEDNGFTLVNTYNFEKQSVKATKVWHGQGGEDDVVEAGGSVHTPAIQIQLWKRVGEDGEWAPSTRADATLVVPDLAEAKAEQLTRTWSDLERYEDNERVYYEAREISANTELYKTESAVDDDGAYTFTNTLLKEYVPPKEPESDPNPEPVKRTVFITYVDHLNAEGSQLVSVSRVDPALILAGSLKAAAGTGFATDAEGPAAVPPNPSHEGKNFVGWLLNKDEFGNYVLVANYEDKPTQHTVTYVDTKTGKIVKTTITDDVDSVPAPKGYKWRDAVVDAAGNVIYVTRYEPAAGGQKSGDDDSDAEKSKPDSKRDKTTASRGAPAPASKGLAPGVLPTTGDNNADMAIALVLLALAAAAVVAAARHFRRRN